ncbi:MAG: hypothetical protein IPJ19_19875 [Planctomycetes bacterium]|nr:hypothetical protein [Planctomycetota bacterium]
MSSQPDRRLVVADANVLINFAHVGRLDLLSALASYAITVPEEVVAEVKDRDQLALLRAEIDAGRFEVCRIDELAGLAIFADLRERLGAGESACITLAAQHGWVVASDERRAVFMREIERRLGNGRLLNTPGLMVVALREALLTVEQADEIKALLEQRRFKMKFQSFGELFPQARILSPPRTRSPRRAGGAKGCRGTVRAGTRAARRAMKSSGSNAIAEVPSRQCLRSP